MGSVTFSSSYSAGIAGSITCNLLVEFSESYNSSTRQTTITVTRVAIQKVNNSTNWGSMTLRGYIKCNGSNMVSFGQGSASVTISINSSGYHNVSGWSSSSVTVSHDATGAASVTWATEKYQSMSIIGAFYQSGTMFGVTAQSKSVNLTNRGAVTYAIGYNANGHGTAPASQTKVYNTTLTLQPFISNQTGTGDTNSYTITGNANGGSWSGSNGSATRTLNYTYTQSSWNTAANGSGTGYSSQGSYTANAAATLYAQWGTSSSYSYTYTIPTGTPTKTSTTTNSLTVSYNANGGSSTPSSQTSSKPVLYTFLGWFTAASGGTQRTSNSQVSASETVYAQYSSSTGNQNAVTLANGIAHANTTENGYLITFDGNGGTTTKTSEQATRTLAWSFDKWALGSANGDRYAAGASFVPSANSTMYATWTTSSANEGSVTVPTAAQCTRTNYTLLGWSTNPNATVASMIPGATYIPTDNRILYAVWEYADPNSAYYTKYVPWVYKSSGWQRHEFKTYKSTGWEKQLGQINDA